MSCIIPSQDLKKEISNSFINFFRDSSENSWFMALGNTLPWSFPRELLEKDSLDFRNFQNLTEETTNVPFEEQTEKIKYDFYRTCTLMKKIFVNDLSFVVKKNQWQPNVTYSAYRHDENMFDESRPPFYVFHNNSIYVCIENNQASPSLVAPDNDQLEYFVTSDDYIWKKICQINQSDITKFEVRGRTDSDSFIPIKFIDFEPSVSTSAEAKTKIIQENAVFGSLSSIYVNSEYQNQLRNDPKITFVSPNGLSLINPPPEAGDVNMTFSFFGEDQSLNTLRDMFVQVISGTGKDQIRRIKSSSVVSNNFVIEIDPLDEGLSSDSKIQIIPGIRIFGDGEARNPISVKDSSLQSALAIPIFNSQNILIGCRLLDIGKNYSFARAFVPKGLAWADSENLNPIPEDILRVSLAPQGGHGSNCISQLGASNINLKTVFGDDDEVSITPTNDFRQIALIKNPLFFENTLLVRISPPTSVLEVGDEVGLKTGQSESPSAFGKILRKFPSAQPPSQTLSYEFLLGEITGSVNNFTHMVKGANEFVITPDDGLELIKFAGSENKLTKEFIMEGNISPGITLDRHILLGIGNKQKQLVPSYAAGKILSRSATNQKLITLEGVRGNFELGENVRAFSPDGSTSYTFTLDAIREPITDITRSSYNMNTMIEIEFSQSVPANSFVVDQMIYFFEGDLFGSSPSVSLRGDVILINGNPVRPKAIGVLFKQNLLSPTSIVLEITGLRQKVLNVNDKVMVVNRKTSQLEFGNINKITEPKILYGSGEILYVQNFLGIERNFGTTEEVNLVIGI
jgi:hypothetical protein